jgi:hypothetical protein
MTLWRSEAMNVKVIVHGDHEIDYRWQGRDIHWTDGTVCQAKNDN